MTEAKRFPTLAVAGAYSGYLLEEGGFGSIHEVMDHLFPGIMTLGLAAMAETASAELGRQLPQLAALGKPINGEWQEYAKRVAELGATLPVLGPLDVSDVDVAAAFDALGRRA